VSTFAITGGAGAYLDAAGYATNGWDRKRKALVLNLHLAKRDVEAPGRARVRELSPAWAGLGSNQRPWDQKS
jgi:hypothetical protein